MTLHTLEDRFKARATDIYNKFSNPDALVEIKPNSPESRSRIKNDSRLTPVVSTIRDTKLISKFLKSNSGLLFIGKQTLLQTGNTFAETRLYNPLGSLIHTIPAVHATRHIGRPSSLSLSSILNPTRNSRGSLQSETVFQLTQPQSGGFKGELRNLARSVTNAVLSPFRAITTTQNYTRPEDEAFKKYGPLLQERTARSERGNVRGTPYQITPGKDDAFENSKQPIFYVTKDGLQSDIDPRRNLNGLDRQSYSDKHKYTKADSKFLIQDTRITKSTVYSGALTNPVFTPRTIVDTTRSRLSQQVFTSTENIGPSKELVIADISMVNPKFDERYVEYLSQTIDGNIKSKTFAELVRTQKPYFEYAKKFTDGYTDGDNAGIAKDEDKLYKSTIKDAFNLGTYADTIEELESLQNNRVAYTPIIRTDEQDAQEKADIIRFIFRSADGTDPVHFRAFISSLNESVTPDFNEQRYLGRTERFITYAGAKRSVSISFNIVAFSVDELDNLWLRMNYLTGLTFPKGVSESGFMIPPLFRITIGKIYENQPCYIETLETQLLDDKITFDIDSEVSKIINVTMTISLLEKTSRFYNSPFYAISQKIITNQSLQRTPRPLPENLVGQATRRPLSSTGTTEV